MSSSATARLTRLLALVPWVTRHQGIELAAAAAHFEVSEQQIVKDLELLFVCGTPGHLPDDLIDARWESGHVYVTNADEIAQPLRLSVDESVVLIAGLQALSEISDVAPHSGLESALAKLTAAVQDHAVPVASVHVPADGHTVNVTTQITHALSDQRRLHLTYYVAGRDELTEREVSPYRLISSDGHGYLHAYCHTALDDRIFRIDRIQTVQVLDGAADAPQASGSGREDLLFTPGEDAIPVTLTLRDGARWVAEYYPTQSQEELPDGGLRITLLVSSTEWVERLVLRLAGRAQVEGPESLRMRVQARAQETLAAYQVLGSSSTV